MASPRLPFQCIRCHSPAAPGPATQSCAIPIALPRRGAETCTNGAYFIGEGQRGSVAACTN
eukprot:5703011-Prorocentrum_lima.AAC.1